MMTEHTLIKLRVVTLDSPLFGHQKALFWSWMFNSENFSSQVAVSIGGFFIIIYQCHVAAPPNRKQGLGDEFSSASIIQAILQKKHGT